jgi:hypothetical protein
MKQKAETVTTKVSIKKSKKANEQGASAEDRSTAACYAYHCGIMCSP